MTTTMVMQEFLQTPYSNYTSLDQLPGLGEASVKKIKRHKVRTPYQLMSKFLYFDRDPIAFQNWLINKCGMRSQDAAKNCGIVDAMEAKCRSLFD